MLLFVGLICWNLALLCCRSCLVSIPFGRSILILLWIRGAWLILVIFWSFTAGHEFLILREIGIIRLILSLIAHLEDHIYVLSYVLLRLRKLLLLLVLWWISRLMVEAIWALVWRNRRRMLLLAMYWMSWRRYLRWFTVLSLWTSVTRQIGLGGRSAWIHSLRHISISTLQVLLILIISIIASLPPLTTDLLYRIGGLIAAYNIVIAALITL